MAYFDPSVDFDQMLSRLEKWLNHAPDRILRLTLAELSFKPAPGKWSKKEICGHLIDSAINNLQRFTAAVHAGSHTLQPYPQDALVQINDYQNQPIYSLIRLWKGLNHQIWQLAGSLDEKQLQIPILIGEEQQTLQWLISDYIGHLEHHLAQLFDLKSESKTLPVWQVSLLEAKDKLMANYDTAKFITLMEQGTMSVELYIPEKVDLQQPHEQDELYIVQNGEGIFFLEGERVMFRAGDVLFVPAGKDHRFEQFSDDFITWVIFYGPKGGETTN
jgi:mannose-6-phosphate isomerase-like protein (cupin superfamily)